MADVLPLDDGGAFYHDDRLHGLHPGLRAAAQLLLAVERRRPGVRRELRRYAADGPALDLALLDEPTVRFDPRRGFRIRRGVHTHAGRHRLRRALRPLDAVATWALERHLGSRWLVELLLLTVAAWQELDDGDGDGDGGWGPWMELLSRPPAPGDRSPLRALHHPRLRPYLRPPRRPAQAATLELRLEAWRIEEESWEAAEARLLRRVGEALEEHRRSLEAKARRAGFKPAPSKTAVHHFDWLARRQLEGRSPAWLARRFAVSVSTVHHALRTTAALVELHLRPVPRGPLAD